MPLDHELTHIERELLLWFRVLLLLLVLLRRATGMQAVVTINVDFTLGSGQRRQAEAVVLGVWWVPVD